VAVLSASGVASAQPPVPNVNAMTPANPKDFAAREGTWYAFRALDGVTCVMDRQSGSYGCSGPLPGAPNGANVVTGSETGSVGFGSSPRPMYGTVENPSPLPPNTRLSFHTVSCGNDGSAVSCVNTLNQSGFVIGPAGSYAFRNTVHPSGDI
jgi:hypothetical protein